jgi:hypothetical protein
MDQNERKSLSVFSVHEFPRKFISAMRQILRKSGMRKKSGRYNGSLKMEGAVLSRKNLPEIFCWMRQEM